MRVHIPNSAFLGNLDAFLALFDPSIPDRLDVTTNDRWMSIHPVVLAMIGALGLTVSSKNITFDDITTKSGHYLETMGLFDLLKIPSPMQVTRHEAAGKLIPLTEIVDSPGLQRLITDMVPLLHLPPEKADSLRYILSELVRNVFEHSMSKYGAVVAAQYFKKTNTVRIGVADTGVGIWQTIHESHGARTDLDAIKLALTPGITGKTAREGGTESNAGAGLFFVRSIAKINRDFFVIYSGKGFYKLLKPDKGAKRLILYADPNREKHSERDDLPSWGGTVVGIDLSLDETSELNELLNLIGSTYSSAIQERRRQRFKQPRFV
jgi:anti-sigma regulatory factor (Ser/Thr protein kinase)